jgi:hypothetical protein
MKAHPTHISCINLTFQYALTFLATQLSDTEVSAIAAALRDDQKIQVIRLCNLCDDCSM